MGRLVSAALAGVLAASVLAGPGAAARPESRVQTLEYVGGGVTLGPVRTVAVRAGDSVGAVVFRGGPERFVSVAIEDAHGLPVTGIVQQTEDDEGTYFCGETGKRVKVRPFENVTVYLMNGTCGEAGGSAATSGTVTATFTRR